MTCECGKKVELSAVVKYLYPCMIKLQVSDRFVIRSAPWNLPLAESIMGLLFPLGIRELKRENIVINEKDYVDIIVVKG